MRRLWPAVILVIVCLGAFWYASSNHYFKVQVAAENNAINTFKTEDVQQILMTSDTGKLTLVQENGHWVMKEPNNIPVSDQDVATWPPLFAALTHEGKVDENPTDLTGFGLDKPKQTFQVVMKDGSKHELLIGIKMPTSADYYGKMSDSPVVFKLPEKSVQDMTKTPLDFLDKNAVAFNYPSITGFNGSWKDAKFTLLRTEAGDTAQNSKWKKNDKQISYDQATPLLDKLLYFTTDQMVKPAADYQTGTDVKLEIIETDQGKETKNVYLGKTDKDVVWIFKQDSAWAYSIPIKTMQDMFDEGKK